MVKALLWKEWRSVQFMTLFVVVIITALQCIAIHEEYIKHLTIGVWQLYLLFLGVTAFSSEQSKNNLVFLTSLAVPRATIWSIKLVLRIGIMTLFVLCILTLGSFQVDAVMLTSSSVLLFAFCFLTSLSIVTPTTCASAALAFEVSVVLLLLEFSISLLWSTLALLAIAVVSVLFSYWQFCERKLV